MISALQSMFPVTFIWNWSTWVAGGYRTGMNFGCPSQAGKLMVPPPGLNVTEPCPAPIHTSNRPHTFGTNGCPASLYRRRLSPLTTRGELLFQPPPVPVPDTHDEVCNGHDGWPVSSTIWRDHLVAAVAVTLIVCSFAGFSMRESDIGEIRVVEVHVSVPPSIVYPAPVSLISTPPLPSHA